MSRLDADRDGVEVFRRGRRLCYLIPCSECGRKYEGHQYTGNKRYLCGYCLNKRNHIERELQYQEVGKSKADIRFDKAIEKIKTQVKSINAYDNAIRIARRRCERYRSIPEAMVAVELIRLKYGIIPQQKIGKYRVDFAIPRDKMIVEVDGSIYHKDVERDLQRDASIQYALGFEWTIIHISADLISDNILLLESMMNNERYKTKSI